MAYKCWKDVQVGDKVWRVELGHNSSDILYMKRDFVVEEFEISSIGKKDDDGVSTEHILYKGHLLNYPDSIKVAIPTNPDDRMRGFRYQKYTVTPDVSFKANSLDSSLYYYGNGVVGEIKLILVSCDRELLNEIFEILYEYYKKRTREEIIRLRSNFNEFKKYVKIITKC